MNIDKVGCLPEAMEIQVCAFGEFDFEKKLFVDNDLYVAHAEALKPLQKSDKYVANDVQVAL